MAAFIRKGLKKVERMGADLGTMLANPDDRPAQSMNQPPGGQYSYHPQTPQQHPSMYQTPTFQPSQQGLSSQFQQQPRAYSTYQPQPQLQYHAQPQQHQQPPQQQYGYYVPQAVVPQQPVPMNAQMAQPPAGNGIHQQQPRAEIPMQSAPPQLQQVYHRPPIPHVQSDPGPVAQTPSGQYPISSPLSPDVIQSPVQGKEYPPSTPVQSPAYTTPSAFAAELPADVPTTQTPVSPPQTQSPPVSVAARTDSPSKPVDSQYQRSNSVSQATSYQPTTHQPNIEYHTEAISQNGSVPAAQNVSYQPADQTHTQQFQSRQHDQSVQQYQAQQMQHVVPYQQSIQPPQIQYSPSPPVPQQSQYYAAAAQSPPPPPQQNTFDMQQLLYAMPNGSNASGPSRSTTPISFPPPPTQSQPTANPPHMYSMVPSTSNMVFPGQTSATPTLQTPSYDPNVALYQPSNNSIPGVYSPSPFQTNQIVLATQPGYSNSASNSALATVTPNQVQQYTPAAPQPTVSAPQPQTPNFTEPAPSVLRVQREGNMPTAKKILCLDGGGIRGLASLYILKHLMDRLENERGGRLEPWQEFDMIGGTSTGGLIAVMLGRLRMSVDECIDAYISVSRDIFTPKHSKSNVPGRVVAKLKAEGKFESEPMEECVKRMLREKNISEVELLKDGREDSPKVFVCAVQAINSDAVVIRSYKSGSGEYDELYSMCKIWEAVRATSAASTFFPPIKIGHQRYVDGALRYNNPIEKVDQESSELWPNSDRLIISIGTGSAPGPNLLGNAVELVKTLAKIVTDSEEENSQFRRRNQRMIDANLLYRFNVLQGLADVRLEEWEAVEEISAHSSTYLRSPDAAREFTKCAHSLHGAGQRLGYIAGDELKTHLKIQKLSAVCCEFCEDCHRGVSYNQELFMCVECQMNICEDCCDAHDDAHIGSMIRFELMQWIHNLPGVQPTVSCRVCPRRCKSRWECKTCGFALCRSCAGDKGRRTKFFDEHQKDHPAGREFIAIYPPFWSVTPKWAVDPCPCVDLASETITGHCESCHKCVAMGIRSFWCRTCRKDYGVSQWLCQECFDRETDHRSKHEFGTIDIVFEPNNTSNSIDDLFKAIWGCAICPTLRFEKGKEHTHEHSQLLFFLNPFLVEVIQMVNYQSCRRGILTKGAKKATKPTGWKCQLCTTELEFDKLGSVCLSTKCGFIYCESCTEAKRQGHRHLLYEFTSMKPPENNFNQNTCCYCKTMYFAMLVQGLWCADCNNHFICLDCIIKVSSTDVTVPEGLPHQKILKPCKVKKGWIMYRING